MVRSTVPVVVGVVIVNVVQSNPWHRSTWIGGGNGLSHFMVHRQRRFEDNRAETGNDSLFECSSGANPNALSDPQAVAGSDLDDLITWLALLPSTKW